MRVVLARQQVGGSPLGGPPEVHAYRVPDPPDAATETEHAPARRDEPEIWSSACGQWAKSNELEIVESFTGSPCMTCFMSAVMASDVAPVTREELEAPPERALEAWPVHEFESESPDAVVVEVVAGPSSGYALSWRGRVVHRVAADAPRTELDGHPLVLGYCGALGWGPYESAPDEWEPCASCDQSTGGRT